MRGIGYGALARRVGVARDPSRLARKCGLGTLPFQGRDGASGMIELVGWVEARRTEPGMVGSALLSRNPLVRRI